MLQPVVDLDSETESNHDTALTLACAGGHEELVTLLLERGADIGKRQFLAQICLQLTQISCRTPRQERVYAPDPCVHRRARQGRGDLAGP